MKLKANPTYGFLLSDRRVVLGPPRVKTRVSSGIAGDLGCMN